MNILFISSEFHPFAKAGGLADAVSSLSQALALRGHRVSVVMPRYGAISVEGMTDLEVPLGVPLGYREEWCGVFHRRYRDVDVYLLEHRGLFGDRPGIYGPSPAAAYHDNARRFAFLSRGALQLALALKLRPAVIHAHDWPSALVPMMVNLAYRPTDHFRNARVVFSIHNIGYQGVFGQHDAAESGLYHGQKINYLKSAVAHADSIVTVSPRYALEIQQPRFGFGLHREIQARGPRVHGVLNGIDTTEWDPATDTLIPAPYSAADMSGKETNKAELQTAMGLPEDPSVALIGMITRLVDQKGVRSLFSPGQAAVYRLCRELPVQVVLLGSGEAWVEKEVRRYMDELPNFRAVVGYDNALAHHIEAGSDFFLMPSVYEPCGLNQMYSMRYGTLPIVTRTGGLADTVDADTGFLIQEATPEAIFAAVEHAVHLHRTQPDRIRTMRTTAMARDFSWGPSAARYEELYSS